MAVVAGSLAHFGTYVVDEADKSLTLQILFTGWKGEEWYSARPYRYDEAQR